MALQWREHRGSTQSSLHAQQLPARHSGNYDVVVSNAFDVVISPVRAAASHVAAVANVVPRQLRREHCGELGDESFVRRFAASRSTTITRRYGIPSAPNSTNGTTRGVKFEANMTAGVAAAINISPVGQNFGGDYRLHFDHVDQSERSVPRAAAPARRNTARRVWARLAIACNGPAPAARRTASGSLWMAKARLPTPRPPR